jgi:hypothetical protein
MPAPTNLYASYNLRGFKEGVDDKIYNLSPEKTSFLSSLPSEKSEVRQPEWQEDSYSPPNKDNALLEGDEFAGEARTPTVMMRNHVQTLSKQIVTSGLANAIAKYGRTSEQMYQEEKAAIELRTDIEAAMLSNNIAVAVGAGSQGKMAGLETICSVNAQHGAGGSTPTPASGVLPTVAPTDGTQRALTNTIFTAGLQAMWNSGGDPRICYLTLGQKTAVNSFAASALATNRVDVGKTGKASIIGAVDVYVWETSAISFVPVYNNRLRARTLFVTDGDSASRVYIRPLSKMAMGPTGDNTKKMMLTDVTLKVKNRIGFLKIADLT